jgi:hypothetical protein
MCIYYLLHLSNLVFCLQAEHILLCCCRRKNIEDNKKNMVVLVVWDKDSYIGRFLMLFPCMCVLQPKLVHLYQTSSLLPSPPSIVASISLRLLYSFLYREHINHIQHFGFLPLPYSTVHGLLLVWSVYNNITALYYSITCIWGRICNFWPSETD